MNVKVLRINTGEEVITSIVEDNEDTLVIKDPIVAYNSGEGQIGFGPWAPLVKNGEDITVDKKYIVYISEAQDEVVGQYKKMFSTIETPSKKLIL